MSNKPETVTKSDEHLTRPQDLLSSRQIDKIDLEIESLRKKIRRIETFFPLIASLLTVVALLFGFYQFQSQQRREFATQSQNQLRSDVDQILRFAHDEKQTISMVSFLLEDMKGLIDSASKGTDKQLAQAFSGSERRVTEALVEQIVHDADFEKQPRDVIFASKVVKKWKDYRDYLQEDANLDKLRRILNNYGNAISGFRKTNPKYLDKVTYNPTTNFYFPPLDYDSSLFKTLYYIVEGFKDHLRLMSGDPAAKNVFLSAFVGSLCNPSVAQTLGDDIKTLGDEIKTCKKE